MLSKLQLFQKTKLVVCLSKERVHLMLLNGSRILCDENIFRHEMPEDIIKDKARIFMQGRKFKEVFLVLKRSEVLQKEFSLDSTSLGGIQSLLKESLPYSPEDMAYGFTLSKQAGDASKQTGLLFSIPEERLLEDLKFLEKLGIQPDEIVTEDQILSWAGIEREKRAPALLLKAKAEEVLVVSLEEGRMKASRCLSRPGENFDDFIHELSLFLVEINVKPKYLYLSGSWSSSHEVCLEKKLGLSIKKLFKNPDGSCFLTGIELWKKYPLISLLPTELKIRKWQKIRKSEIKEVLFLFFIFLGLISLGFSLNLKNFKEEVKKSEKKIDLLKQESEVVRRKKADLELIEKAQASKKGTLDLIRDLSLRLPEVVVLGELRKDKDRFFFKGISPNHAYLTETVGVLEKMEAISEVKLEHTRMKRKYGEEFFEFEVVGIWKN